MPADRVTVESPPPSTTDRPFGTDFASTMASVTFDEDGWGEVELGEVASLSLHPATHALHYGSSCFEGLKAHLGVDGRVRVFRLERHVERMRQSAERLMLPLPDSEQLAEVILEVVDRNRAFIPPPPGSLYLRPTLIGTEANIGAAAAPSKEALLFVLASPVGDYFAGGLRPLSLAIETDIPRTTPQFGMVKAGANYVMALELTQRAKRKLAVDQVLFAPDGDVQETGAANFLLLSDQAILTRSLDGSFLHGVTRDSVLTLARDVGYVVEERPFSVGELLEWVTEGEAALSGTAAVLAPIGTVVHEGARHRVGDGEVGPHTRRLREALTRIQLGEDPDPYGWTTIV